jgi:hypothetical protein
LTALPQQSIEIGLGLAEPMPPSNRIGEKANLPNIHTYQCINQSSAVCAVFFCEKKPLERNFVRILRTADVDFVIANCLFPRSYIIRHGACGTIGRYNGTRTNRALEE